MRNFVAAFIVMLAVSAPAQWMRPAREIRTETNSWTYIPTAKTNAQLVFDWLDDELADIDARLDLDGSSWTNLPGTNDLQTIFDWVDLHWNPYISPGERYLKGTNVIGAVYNPTTFVWSVTSDTVPVDSSGWDHLTPSTDTVQSAFDALDTELGYINSNLNVASVAGAARWAYNNGYVGSPVYSGDGSALIILTNGAESATAQNTNVMYWGSGSNAGKLYLVRPGTYFFTAALAASGTNAVNFWYAYIYHYDSGGSVIGTAPVGTITAQAIDNSGTYIAINASAGDYLRMGIGDVGSSVSHGNEVTLGAQYLFAYKVYNTD